MANTPTENFAIPKPAAGDINWEDEYAQFADLVDSRLMLGGMKNVLINGNFDIWQRGTSFSGNVYSADRWQIDTGGGGSATRQNFTLGQADVPGEPSYFLRNDRTVAASGDNNVLNQNIEGVRTLAGKTVTISFWAKAAASKTFKCDFVQVFGTGGTPSSSVTVAAQDVSLTTNWQKFKLTFAIPSISGKTLGTNGDDFLQLRIREVTTYTTFTADFAQFQLEAGSVATEFEMRPFSLELQLAHRYFERIEGAQKYLGAGYAASSTSGRIVLKYQRKRTTPTITGSAANIINLFFRVSTQTSTALNFNPISDESCQAQVTVASGLTDGDGLSGALINSSAVYIDVDAEL